ncbi:hypothetical protein [Runella slithyformis]|uniref:Uncharacterized protein n=1 Tax=Runella slithyformis (strain ATCC 29530 / DSM 19594 / LMG 11500 / NCIMB 11436 / LSU 4) TaxID=761193 RepID=A0A7U3ZI46_RUNSL|nr:hypothetical protein [Runella slithyformis]AEI47657.1 hypothetical protein Runsl_1229 [Runella slithyformis DSM 19594]
MSQLQSTGDTAGITSDETPVIPQEIPDEPNGPTAGPTGGMTDTPEADLPPDLPTVIPTVIPPVIPPVIPVLPQESGLTQKSLKLSSWLCRELELEAAAGGDTFNGHIVKILSNRSRLSEELEVINNRYHDLGKKYNALATAHHDLQAKNEVLLLESQKQITAKQQIEPQIEILVKVMDAIIEDAAFYSTLRSEFLQERRQHWLNYFLTNPS